MPVSLSDVLTPSKDVVFREIDREVVILDLESGSYFGLNAVGSRAWSLLTEGSALSAVHAALAGEYDVDAGQLEKDLVAWADRLVEKGLLRAV